jgi:hypothetical protein
MSKTQQEKQPRPLSLIEEIGKPIKMIAQEAGINYLTVHRAYSTNLWPSRYGPREALRKVLGYYDHPIYLREEAERLAEVKRLRAAIEANSDNTSESQVQQ